MNTKKIILLLFLVLIVTIGFELYNLTAISLWHDEAFSALLIQYDFKEMMYRIGLDVHPPFYYIILKGWDFLFGNSLFSLRAFSVFFSALTVLGVYLFVKEAFKNKRFALFSSALVAFSSFQIQFAMEARMFTLGAFLIVLSSFFLLKAIKSKNWSWWLFYAVTCSCGIYTHYYVFFSILAQGLFVLYYLFRESKFNFFAWLKNKNFQFSFGAYSLVILSYLPWMSTFLSQAGQVRESYWIPPINPGSIPCTFFKMTTGEGIDPIRFWYILILLMAIIVAAIVYALKKIKTSAKWLFFLLLIVPFLGATVLSLKTSIYLDRYFIFALIFYLTLIGGAILAIKNKFARNTLIGAAILGSLVAFPIRWANLDVEKKPGMTAAAAYLNQEVHQFDKIYVGSSFVYFTFKHYNKTGVHPLLYAPGPLLHFSGTALLSPEDIIKDFYQGGIEEGNIVWIINTTGFGNYQPEVPSHWIKEEEKSFQDVYDYRGWIIVTKYRVQ